MKNNIKKLLSLPSISFKIRSVYKVNSLIIILSGIVTALVQFYLWSSIERGSIETNIPIEAIILYSLMAILVNLLLPTKDIANYFSDLIYEGKVMVPMAQTYSLFNYLLFYQMGNSLYTLCFEFVPLLLTYILFFDIKISLFFQFKMVIFLISLLISYISSTILGYIIGIMAIYTTSVNGIYEFYSAMLVFFGGAVFPLSIYPHWLFNMAKYLPFSSIIGAPLTILSNIESNYLQTVLVQIFWLLVLIILFNFTNKKALKNLAIMGG